MKRILSGITPSGDGNLHIGNYLGAVKQFIELSSPLTSSGRTPFECFLMFADLHALTTVQDKAQLQKNIEALILNEIALVGFDNPNVVFFRQSDVPMHAELQSILNNVTPLGLLKRAHAYKDKLQTETAEEEINLGLFNYPILMAADILLYKPDEVPVGKDQKQHIEITRDIAERFNRLYSVSKGVRPSSNSRSDPGGGVFKLPEPRIPEEVAVILGTDGQRKMSKSLGNIISIFGDEATIRKQVNSTYTDPTRAHATDPGHIAGNMCFAYLDHFGSQPEVDQLKADYEAGKVGDVEVKEYLFKSLLAYFQPARTRYEKLSHNPKKVKEILEQGAQKASQVAGQTMKEVRDAIGLTNQYSFFEYSFRHPDQAQRMEGSNSTAFAVKGSLDGVYPDKIGTRDDNVITINDFAQIEQRVGKVVAAQNVEGSEKLIRLTVDFGPAPDGAGLRTIFTGVRPFGYTPEFFQDKQFFFVVNLAPRRMMNEFSQGMILAVDGLELTGEHGAAKPLFVSAEGMPIGARIR